MQETRTTDARADERRMLAESVADFAERATDMARVRKWRGVEPGFDIGLWREMAGMGWTGLLIPERFGGMELGFGEMAEVCRGLARVLTPEPILTCAVLAARAIALSENDQLAADLLPGIASGDSIAALAWQERAGDLDSRAPATRASMAGGQLTLNGTKRFISGAAGANGYIVSAINGPDTVLVWLPADTPGMTATLSPIADGRFTAEVTLADARIPER